MLATMPEDEFRQHLVMLKLARTRVQEIQTNLMELGVHYGRVPGVEKPFLHQPGAEVLAQPLHLVPEYIGPVEWGDGVNRPLITINTECRLHFGTLDGPVVGTGRGVCTSWERKYRYRQADKSCPECQKVGTVRKGKADKGGGWYCWSKMGGCGAQFRNGDKRIEDQVVGTIENPDQADLLQTIQAMADKRAYVKAVRTTTATSDLFTQDEDQVETPAGGDAGTHTTTAKPETTTPAQQPAKEPPTTKKPPEDLPPVTRETFAAGLNDIRASLAPFDKVTAPSDLIGEDGALTMVKGGDRCGWTRENLRDLVRAIGGNLYSWLTDVSELPRSTAKIFYAVIRRHSSSFLEAEEPPFEVAADPAPVDPPAAPQKTVKPASSAPPSASLIGSWDAVDAELAAQGEPESWTRATEEEMAAFYGQLTGWEPSDVEALVEERLNLGPWEFPPRDLLPLLSFIFSTFPPELRDVPANLDEWKGAAMAKHAMRYGITLEKLNKTGPSGLASKDDWTAAIRAAASTLQPPKKKEG